MFEYQSEFYNTSDAKIIAPFINNLVRPSSVLDVGCGLGTWLKVFQSFENVNEIFGIDAELPQNGEFLLSENVFHAADLNIPFNLNKKFDLILCLEVAEHLNKSSADNFINSLCLHSDVIVFSAAIPYQEGQGHINLQWPSYWKDKFAKNNYLVSDILRKNFWNNEGVKYWYKQNMLLFVKRDKLDSFNIITEESILPLVHPGLYQNKINENKRINKYWLMKWDNPGVRESFGQFLKALKRKITND